MMNRTHYRRTKQAGRGNLRRRGSILIETAAAVVFLLVPLLLGIIQFGLFYNASNVLSQVSREGGRYIAVNWNNANSDANTKAYMVTIGQQGNVPVKASDITITPAYGARTQFSKVVVRVNYNMGPSLQNGGKTIFPALFGSNRVVTRTYTVMTQ